MPSPRLRFHRVLRHMHMLAGHRWTHYLVLACAMTCLASAMHASHWRWADALDNYVLDASFRLREPHTPAEVAESLPATRDIVLIELPHPVPRRLLAQLVDSLHQARAVAFDLMLVDQARELNAIEQPWYTHEVKNWARETQALVSAQQRANNVVIGAWVDEAWVENPQMGFTKERVWQHPIPGIWANARYHAHLLVSPDPHDHVTRRVPLYQEIPQSAASGNRQERITRVPCLGLALAAAAERISPARLDQLLHHLSPTGGYLQLGAHRIPYDRDGMVTIDYVGGRQCFEFGTNRVVYDRVLRLYQPADFADKLVIIGSADLKSNDFFATPYGTMSGMQVHANVVATFLNRTTAFRVPDGMIVGLAFVCSVLTLLPLLRWPLGVTVLLTLAEICLVALGMAWGIASTHASIAASVPILAIALTYNIIVLYEYSRIRFTLGKFIGPDMLKRALYHMTHLRLGEGHVEEASVLFCDLRGYATLSESLPVETVTAVMNAYTDMVVTIAGRYHGRAVDFAGDGVFILFERSLAGRQFPMRAVEAAWAVHEAFLCQRERWIAQGLPGLTMGGAVHTGTVMIGLLGSRHFLKMGAIGDVVNVAARVQALSLECGYAMLVTKETRTYLDQHFPIEPCGQFRVRGREQLVEVYGLSATRLEEQDVPGMATHEPMAT